MASSGHYPTQTYDGYKAVEVLDPACTEYLARGRIFLNITFPDLQNATTSLLGRSHVAILGSKLQTSGGICGVGKVGLLEKSSQFLRPLLLMVLQGILLREVARWTNVGGPIPVSGRPIYSSSEVPISRINTEGIVKQIRQIANSPPNSDAEGSDELDGEEVELVPNSAGNPVNSSPSHPPAKRIQSHIIHNTPRNFQPTIATIPPASPNPSHTRLALETAVRPYPFPQPINSPMVTSQQPQPVASTSRRREECTPLPFPAAQVFQSRDKWPI
ncbi:hypothetical protein O181_023028 [Austropuccinia psidii MF-1]|uniref:Uncharacterized protein n=1 Tax=Austropuccinia psidii MF-1 TaxID=1389203 RepID=A0A9Q3CI14_9BASI|nr:hypothetical protein [Austropuccinia psidii MF-1]